MSRLSRAAAALGVLLLFTLLASDWLAPQRLPDIARALLYTLAVSLCAWALMRSRAISGCDASTPALRRRYLREFVPAMTGYVLAVLLSVWALRHVETLALRAVLALLPLPPVALALRAVMRHIRDSDELQRRIELEAVSFATALVSLGYLGAALLQMARVIDVPAADAMFWVFPLVSLIYGIAKLLVARRYA